MTPLWACIDTRELRCGTRDYDRAPARPNNYNATVAREVIAARSSVLLGVVVVVHRGIQIPRRHVGKYRSARFEHSKDAA